MREAPFVTDALLSQPEDCSKVAWAPTRASSCPTVIETPKTSMLASVAIIRPAVMSTPYPALRSREAE